MYYTQEKKTVIAAITILSRALIHFSHVVSVLNHSSHADPLRSDSSGLACYNSNNYVTNAVQGQKRQALERRWMQNAA